MNVKLIYLCCSEDDDSGEAFEKEEDAINYCKENKDYSWTTIYYHYH